MKLLLQEVQKIKKYRNEGRDIIYGDVTCVYYGLYKDYTWRDVFSKGINNKIAWGPRLIFVQAGNAKGFVTKASLVMGDCRSIINKEIYDKWLRERLIPNMQPNSVFVVDEISYKSTIEEKVPNSKSSKKTMRNWLASKNIRFDSQCFQPELYEMIKKHKDLHIKYSLDTIMEANGHKVLILPPHHPEFNPIENIWSKIKGKVETFWSEVKGVNYYDVALNSTEMLRLADIFAAIGPEEWHQAVDQAIRCEDEFMTLEYAMDIRQDQLTVETETENNDWSSDDSSSSDSLDTFTGVNDTDSDTEVHLPNIEELGYHYSFESESESESELNR
ncbi:uncharacterized protein [Choristoneura fumiferana]|uniref:uncharacterized protein n=1 Tax=Choristoneura fumiferana TaxID=7141 RepID=UPI003D15A454